MKRREDRAVVFIQPERWHHFDEHRQQRLLLPFLADRQYELTSLTTDPRAAVDLAAVGLVDVVVVAIASEHTDELEAQVQMQSVRFEAVRRSGATRQQLEVGAMIRRAAARGMSVEVIAGVFDLHPDAVRLAVRDPATGRAVAVANVRHADRRPRRVGADR